MPSALTVYRWELFKLRHQKRTYLGLGAAVIVPILFVVAIHFRHRSRGGDFAFSSYLDRSGLVVPLLIQLIGILPGLGSLQPYLLSTQFNAWQGLLRTPIDWEPIVRAAWVCALYGIPALIACFLVFMRRDVAGG